LIDEPAYYKQSVFRHQPPKIEITGKIMSRRELFEEQDKAKEAAQLRAAKAEV
jgi:hypothetical protein